ncbi:hypothetical protein TNCV_2928701 [Trichonephila clavipes]|nr:hypothetical protein TNCV_2928701 [Trichonephila clavipes]
MRKNRQAARNRGGKSPGSTQSSSCAGNQLNELVVRDRKYSVECQAGRVVQKIEEKEMDDLRVVYVKVKGEQEMVNAVIDTGAQMPVKNSQMIRNPKKLREPSKKEGIISSTDSKSVCSQEVVTDLLPETQSLLNVPNGDLVAVKINGSNVQTNGQGIKESKAPTKNILREFLCEIIPGLKRLSLSPTYRVPSGGSPSLDHRYLFRNTYAHKPRKSSPIQDTDDEDMIVYDMEQIETPKEKYDKYFLSEE